MVDTYASPEQQPLGLLDKDLDSRPSGQSKWQTPNEAGGGGFPAERMSTWDQLASTQGVVGMVAHTLSLTSSPVSHGRSPANPKHRSAPSSPRVTPLSGLNTTACLSKSGASGRAVLSSELPAPASPARALADLPAAPSPPVPPLALALPPAATSVASPASPGGSVSRCRATAHQPSSGGKASSVAIDLTSRLPPLDTPPRPHDAVASGGGWRARCLAKPEPTAAEAGSVGGEADRSPGCSWRGESGDAVEKGALIDRNG